MTTDRTCRYPGCPNPPRSGAGGAHATTCADHVIKYLKDDGGTYKPCVNGECWNPTVRGIALCDSCRPARRCKSCGDPLPSAVPAHTWICKPCRPERALQSEPATPYAQKWADLFARAQGDPGA